MKKFKFKLQPLLKYRQYLERIAQQKTASAHVDVKNCENHIKELKHTHETQIDKVTEAVLSGISGSFFQQYNEYLDSVELSIEQERLKKIELKKVLQEKLLELKKKSVDKKAMELYREKLKDIYTQEMLKEEQKELDEITILKTARSCRQ